MQGQDEVIVGALAPARVWEDVERAGCKAIAADFDLEIMNVTPETVLDQVTVHTREVFVTPLHGVLGEWQTLAAITEPRGIHLRVEGKGKVGRWEPIAAGVRGMGDDLLHVDAAWIVGGASGLKSELAQLGLEVSHLEGPALRKRDYPGVAKIQQECLVVPGWRQRQEEITAAAERLARQLWLPFAELRREPGRAESSGHLVRRAG